METSWCPVDRGETDIVAKIGIIVDPDRKFGYAALKVDAITSYGNRVRLYTKNARGLRLRAKKNDVLEIYRHLVGKILHFQLFKSPDGRVEMFFPIQPTKKELALLKEETEKLLRYV